MLYPSLSDQTSNSTHSSLLQRLGYFTALSAALWDWQVHEAAQRLQFVQVIIQKLIDGGIILKVEANAMEVKASQALGTSSGRFSSLLSSCKTKGLNISWLDRLDMICYTTLSYFTQLAYLMALPLVTNLFAGYTLVYMLFNIQLFSRSFLCGINKR